MKNELTYQEAQKAATKIPWKVSNCNSGESCWCRIIEPIEPITDKDGNDIYIVGSGSIDKVFADYIVSLHNDTV